MFKIISANTFKRPVFAPQPAEFVGRFQNFSTDSAFLVDTNSWRQAESDNHITNTIWGKKRYVHIEVR